METCTALHLRQKSIISSGPASGPASAVGAPHTDSQCFPVSELLIISTLATAKPRAEAEAEADSENFDTFGTLQTCLREAMYEMKYIWGIRVLLIDGTKPLTCR